MIALWLLLSMVPAAILYGLAIRHHRGPARSFWAMVAIFLAIVSMAVCLAWRLGQRHRRRLPRPAILQPEWRHL